MELCKSWNADPCVPPAAGQNPPPAYTVLTTFDCSNSMAEVSLSRVRDEYEYYYHWERAMEAQAFADRCKELAAAALRAHVDSFRVPADSPE